MERLIYCPSDDKIEEAIKLSKNNSLQILVGDNFYTKDLIFDRNIVSVIKIPQKKTVNYIEYVTQHLHQNIEYINEYVEIKNKIKLFIDEIEVKPVYEESHRAKFIYLCDNLGVYNGCIMIDGKIEEEFKFIVCSKKSNSSSNLGI